MRFQTDSIYPEASTGNLLSSVCSAAGYLAVPVVCITLYFFYARRRTQPLASPVLPGVPLLLIPVCLQVLFVIESLLAMFQHIASQRATGVMSIYDVLLQIQSSTVWHLAGIALGLVFLGVIAVVRKRHEVEPPPRIADPEIDEGSVLDPTSVFLFLALLAVGVLCWFSAALMHVLNLFLDPTQQSVIAARFGRADIAHLVNYITHSFALQAAGAVILIVLLLVLGILTLIRYVPRNPHSRVSTPLAALMLVALCGAIAGTALNIGDMKGKVAAIRKAEEAKP